jgi:hypothetical protein
VNRRGALIDKDLERVRLLLSRGMNSPTAETFLHDGELFCEALAEAVHAGVDPGEELERQTRAFMTFGRNFGTAAFGSAVRRAGMSTDEAVTALTEGKWDPYADLEIPR